MYNKVIFYCHYGNGDIFESREFVKEWMVKIPALEYYYAHGKHSRILLDIPELKHCNVTPIMDMRKDVFEIDNVLYVNTWIGRDSRYVLPGVGCVIPKFYEMNNDMLDKLFGYNGNKLQKQMIDYIPTIKYSCYDIDHIHDFLHSFPEKKILICNGNVQSNQAENFNMTPVINRLAKYYKDIAFIVNIYSTDKIIRTDSGFDLNEISFLSKFCDVIIGRSSGPFLFTQTKENWMNPDKKFLSFTYKFTGANIVYTLPVKARAYWSDFVTEDAVYYKCIEVIEQ
ncbi:MAG: hypothetical protein WC554_12395 [Clostridia bacterium]